MTTTAIHDWHFISRDHVGHPKTKIGNSHAGQLHVYIELTHTGTCSIKFGHVFEDKSNDIPAVLRVGTF
jgi:hypothetical protein